MNRYTISPEFLESSADLTEHHDYFADVLMVFAQDNQYKLCIDEDRFAYNIYKEIILKHQCLQTWLKLLNRRKNKIEIVSIPKEEYPDRRDIFISIANEVHPSKQLLTTSKVVYSNKNAVISQKGIALIDGTEAKVRLNQKNVTIVYQSTFGSNSPIVNGNENKL